MIDVNVIAPALISAAVTLIICIINNRAESEKTRTLVAYRLEQLEKKVEKHNNLIERTFKLEESTALQEAELKRLNERMKIVEGE